MKVYEVLRLLAVTLAAVVLLRDMVGPKHRKVLGLTLVFVAMGMAMSLITTKSASAPVAERATTGADATAEALPTLVSGERFTITQTFSPSYAKNHYWAVIAQDGTGQRWINFDSNGPLPLGLRVLVAKPTSPIGLDPRWCLLPEVRGKILLTSIEGQQSATTTLSGVSLLVDKSPR